LVPSIIRASFKVECKIKSELILTYHIFDMRSEYVTRVTVETK